ncbi:hypothetical protein, partial [Shewanella sp. AC34-MNA-CIBAN-0136]|uniref:hypothetical protein n=1 Tax=Shewanella sp. AC34-MNA-CIBAN-0136 TaxID=3140463 RepID=UPI003332A6F8
QEGIAVDPLLARAGWNLAILIQTKFKNRYGEAPRRWWPKAIAKTKTKEQSWIPAHKHYRNDGKWRPE